MSDTNGLQDPVEGTQTTETESQESQVDNSLVEEMLKGVSADHRPIVEPLVTQWNQSANKRFQQIHDSYKGYKDLGEIQELQHARRVYDLLRNDPEAIYDAIVDEFRKNPKQTEYLRKSLEFLGAPSPASESKQEVPAEFQGLPEKFIPWAQQQQQLIQQLATVVLNGQQQSEQAKQDQELQDWLDQQHKQFGKFDEDYFLLQIHRGASEAEAAKMAAKLVEPDPPQKQTVPAISGGGIVPSGQQKVAEMSNDDLDNLVAAALAKAAESGM